MLLADLYYSLRWLLPRPWQIRLRRALMKYLRSYEPNEWPILETAARTPDGWSGWPDGKEFTLVLTHDVETGRGLDRCRTIMDMEEARGLRSCFGFVPERYRVPSNLRDEMVSRGFEISVHGLNHDGHLFKSTEIFNQRAPRINQYLADWGAVGFRAPSMRRNLALIGELDIEYDSSTFDTDPFEPESRGVGTIFPFIWEDPGVGSYVEIPYTLPQDFTLFVLLSKEDNAVWKKKLDWIADRGGMALLDAHPDYMAMGGGRARIDEYPVALYSDLLQYITREHEGRFWHVLPRELAAFWKEHYPDSRMPG